MSSGSNRKRRRGRPSQPRGPRRPAPGSRAAQPRREPPAGRSTGAAPPERPSRLEVRDGVARPDAIWAPFPLTELGIAIGLAIFAAGFATAAPALLASAVLMLAVVVGELCLREHFAGYRSHSLLLGLLPVAAVHLGATYLLELHWRGAVALAVDLALAGALALWLQRRFVAARERALLRRR